MLTKPSGLQRLNDSFLELPFATGTCAAEKQTRLSMISHQMSQRVINACLDDNVSDEILNTTMLLAHEPSLTLIARGRPHTSEDAQEIFMRVSDVARFILDGDHLKSSRRHIGQGSQVAIGGLLWWGIANERLPGGSYVLPSTTSQDIGTLEGRRNGFDFTLRSREGKKVQKTPIQVKTTHRLTDRQYDESILVVTPHDLEKKPKGHEGRESMKKLLGFIADETDTALGARFGRFKDRLASKQG